MSYRNKTTEELVRAYADEADRISKEDAEITRTLIKKELKRRFNAFVRLLDDEQTEANPAGTYNYLLGR